MVSARLITGVSVIVPEISIPIESYWVQGLGGQPSLIPSLIQGLEHEMELPIYQGPYHVLIWQPM